LFDSQAHPSDQPCLCELCSSEAAQDTVRSHVNEVRGSNLRNWFIAKGAEQIHPHLPDWLFISLQNSTFNIQGRVEGHVKSEPGPIYGPQPDELIMI